MALTDDTKEAADLKLQIEHDDVLLKKKRERLEELRARILAQLDADNIDKIEMHGFKFFKKEMLHVKIPRTPEEKEALFNFLKDRGEFMELVSVNSQTLNAFYKRCAQEFFEHQGPDDPPVLEYDMPGVGVADSRITLEMRRG